MTSTQRREGLANRRRSETFNVECSRLAYTATASWFDDGRLAELFLNNHKSNSAADVNAKDAAIALQNVADVEVIRKALCRDSHGRASGPLGAALEGLTQTRHDVHGRSISPDPRSALRGVQRHSVGWPSAEDG
jgi:hypothetical protein